MKSTILTLIGLCLVTLAVNGQEEVVTKSFSVKESDKITLEFKYPELVQIKTWDKNEVQIKATLYINDGKDNDSFELTSEANRDGLMISSEIKGINKFKNTSYYIGRDSDDEDNEDVMITRNGTSLTIGNGKPGSHNGVRISVVLEVTVPQNADLSVDAQYGMVEVIDLPKILSIQAKYGGADITLAEASVESLWAATSWGQIYANLSQEMTIGGNDMLGKEMTARIEGGSGKKSTQNMETSFSVKTRP
ncbi:hypothetical protein N9223_00820 [bacterium]|nr:hypothetical protein [Roseivirga sp.]MDB4538449.1 hypothetical protein [bacterium]